MAQIKTMFCLIGCDKKKTAPPNKDVHTEFIKEEISEKNKYEGHSKKITGQKSSKPVIVM